MLDVPYSLAPFSTEISRTKPPGPSRKRTFRKTNDFIARRIESRSLDDEIERMVVESEQEGEEEEEEEEDTREMQRAALRIPLPSPNLLLPVVVACICIQKGFLYVS